MSPARFMSLSNLIFWSLLLVGCAGMERSCSSCNAESFGADWVITKSDWRGTPYRCWKLTSVSVDNEPRSDGIYWKSPDGHLVHISGHYDRVQVQSGNWPSAYAELGISEATCTKIQARRYDPMTDTWHITGEPERLPTGLFQPVQPQPTPEQIQQLLQLRGN